MKTYGLDNCQWLRHQVQEITESIESKLTGERMNNNYNSQACNMVGDGQSPNTFFVTLGNNTFLMTEDFNEAYNVWQALPRNQETTLEDRQYGVICSTEPGEDYTGLRTYDDSQTFLRSE